MSTDIGTPDSSSRPDRTLAERALPTVLVVAFIWYVIEPLLRETYWISKFGSKPGLQISFALDEVASLVASVPIVCLLVLAWKRSAALARLYWILPLFFGAMGVANIIAHAIGARDAALTVGDVGGVVRGVVTCLVSVALWLCRPQYDAKTNGERS